MKLSQYQDLVCSSTVSIGEPDSNVLRRLRRLGNILRSITQEACDMGYSLEELASINIEDGR